ncbi:MAG: 50S ribosomal protein L11 methyltransferase [Oscillospiraceae bacterium]
MRYIEVTVNTPAEDIDLHCQQMADMGAGGFVIENERSLGTSWKTTTSTGTMWTGSWRTSSKVSAASSAISPTTVRVRRYCEKSRPLTEILRPPLWRTVTGRTTGGSTASPSPLEKKLVVVPEWEEIPQDGRLPLRLDPGLIFGTGSHATTRMCLAALEKYSHPGVKVLDLGCGSGILGIGALILGCDSCFGVDVDPKAPAVVMSNAALNGIGPDRMQVCAGDIIADTSLQKYLGSGYQLVLANIVADVIIPLSAVVRRFMAEGAVFICSGIIEHRWPETEAALKSNSFEILEHRSEDEWHCFVCR